MDNHPPARRPHKSPAHTVKDPRGRPQRLSRYPSRITKVPEGADYLTANFDSVNTVPVIFFGSPLLRSGLSAVPSSGPRILQQASNPSTGQNRLVARPRRDQSLHLSGARIVHTHNGIWKGFLQEFFRRGFRRGT